MSLAVFCCFHFRQVASLILISSLAFAPLAFAQQAPGNSPGNSNDTSIPIIRVSSKLVLVDVVVTDKQRHPVDGLKAEDFSIYESGKQQKVAIFQSIRHGQTTAPPSLPDGIYSNKPELRAPEGNLTVLLIDAVNTQFKDQAYARQQMLKWVTNSYQPGTRMAIYGLTGNLRVLQDFTSDPRLLKLAIDESGSRRRQLATSHTSQTGGGQ